MKDFYEINLMLAEEIQKEKKNLNFLYTEFSLQMINLFYLRNKIFLQKIRFFNQLVEMCKVWYVYTDSLLLHVIFR